MNILEELLKLKLRNDNIEFNILLDEFIILMKHTNTNNITKSECLTYNDFFLNYEELVDIIITYKNNYKDETQINELIGELNKFLDFDISNINNINELKIFFDIIYKRIELLNEHISKWSNYFIKLKKALSNIKVADAKINNEDVQFIYDAKTDESQKYIDDLIYVYNNYTNKEYIEYKQILMNDIKID